MIRSVVLSMLASLWPNGSTQRARVSRLDYIEDCFLSVAASVLGTEMASSPVTVTFPAVMRASLRVMARPSPVPPKRCAVEGGWSRNKEISPSPNFVACVSNQFLSVACEQGRRSAAARTETRP